MVLTQVGVVPATVQPAATGRRGARPDQDAVDLFAEQVICAGAAVRVPSLLRSAPAGALYYVPDRHGVAVIALPSACLSAAQIEQLLRFRFSQYLDIGFVDRTVAFELAMQAEPAHAVSPGDLHVIAGVPATGEILCYAVIEQPPAAGAGCRLRCEQRELFPVERVHGAGVFNRLPILPDLAVARIREMGRFVRNQHPVAGRELVTRAVVETGVALFRLLAGPLSLHVDAVVGDLEEHVAKTNLDFFHAPSVVVHAAVPYPDAASYLLPRYRLHTVYPFALLTSDLASALPRLDAVEGALEHPGKRVLLALGRLRSRGAPTPSMLCPPQDADAPGELDLAQPETGITERGRLLREGTWLRQIPAFATLSLAEAALLSARMQQVEVAAGRPIARQGNCDDALYLIRRGQASIELSDDGTPAQCLGQLAPGQCYGHNSILTGARHPVSVIANSDVTVLRLSKSVHDTYLAHLPEVAARLGQDALSLLAAIDRHRRENPRTPVESCGCGDDCACIGHDHTPAAHDTAAPTPRPTKGEPR